MKEDEGYHVNIYLTLPSSALLTYMKKPVSNNDLNRVRLAGACQPMPL